MQMLIFLWKEGRDSMNLYMDQIGISRIWIFIVSQNSLRVFLPLPMYEVSCFLGKSADVFSCSPRIQIQQISEWHGVPVKRRRSVECWSETNSGVDGLFSSIIRWWEIETESFGPHDNQEIGLVIGWEFDRPADQIFLPERKKKRKCQSIRGFGVLFWDNEEKRICLA